MAFIILLVYQTLFLLRVHEWSLPPGAEALPLTTSSLGLALLVFMFMERDKYFSASFWLLVLLCPFVMASALFNGWGSQGFIVLQNFVPTAVIPLLLYSNLVNSARKTEIMMFVFLVYAMVMLSNGQSQVNAVDGIGWSGARIYNETRITFLGVLSDPNDLGGFFIICIPFAAYFATYGSGIFLRLFGKVSFLLLYYGIYLTNSRGTLVAAMVMALVYVFYRYGKTKGIWLSVLTLPVMLVVMGSFRAISTEDSSAEGRAEAWYAGYQMLIDNPVFGVGMTNFIEHHYRTAHNSFILVLSELGVPGYFIWFIAIGIPIYFLSYFFFVHIKARKAQQPKTQEKAKPDLSDPFTRLLLLNNALFFSMLGFMTTAFFLSRSYVFLMYFMIAMGLASYRNIKTVRPEYEFDNMTVVVRNLVGMAASSVVGMYLMVKLIL